MLENAVKCSEFVYTREKRYTKAIYYYIIIIDKVILNLTECASKGSAKVLKKVTAQSSALNSLPEAASSAAQYWVTIQNLGKVTWGCPCLRCESAPLEVQCSCLNSTWNHAWM